MDDDVCCTGAFHDIAGAGAFLRWPRPREECLVDSRSMSRDCRPRDDPLVGGRLFSRFFTRVALHWGTEICFSRRRRRPTEQRLFVLGFAERVRHVSTDVRHHHAGFNHRGSCRKDEIRSRPCVRRRLDVRGVFSNRPHGVGNRWLDEWGLESGRKDYCNRFCIDFAGGTVVHMTSGWSALVLCILLGHRIGFRKEIMAPHSMVLCMVGTGLLWVGWYGFNAGSALAPDGIAANAFMSTTLATAVASFTWAMLEYALRGKPSVLGFCSGAVAGLVVITPACGYVAPSGAVIIGVAAGIVPFFACTKLKSWLGYDDALDTFGIHAVGGTLGAFLTGLLATAAVNPNLSSTIAGPLNPATQNGLARIVGHTLWIEQSKAIVVTIILAVVGSAIIGAIVRGAIGLRIPPEIERQGLDINQHGEEGYITS